jgi:uncharacterized membrane protein|tara:strand:+ start:789 stop:1283 length:495 start_codon:yes stop_codon:yes gene_type:complete
LNSLDIALVFAVLTCSLVTGFIFTYAVVVMPGFSKLEDKEFLRAFQVTDGVIQNNQPLFMLTWVGSIISVLSVMAISILSLGVSDAWIIFVVGLIYLLGVQGITISIHLPLNNHIQKIDINDMNNQSLNEERTNFEMRWNYFNKIRTFIAFAASLSFLLILMVR